MGVSTGVALVIGAQMAATAGAVARNQQMKSKSGATTEMNKQASAAEGARQRARELNQAPDKDALDRARQSSVLRLQQSSGRASTFLSGSGLGG